uniref:Uncharacterized protein MANES_05G054700 n=1 Tax=Rhizophora mucronata TaxID=61149 RepID=A0A2P2LQH8_RHIMU
MNRAVREAFAPPWNACWLGKRSSTRKSRYHLKSFLSVS